jgi:hypothetical protein
MRFSFSPGDIIYLQKVSYTDHPKLHLVLSISDDLFFVINSGIDSTIAFNEIFKKCQVECRIHDPQKKLTKDKGYIDCHEIADSIFSIEVEKMLKLGKAKNFGRLDDITLNAVLDVVKNHC